MCVVSKETCPSQARMVLMSAPGFFYSFNVYLHELDVEMRAAGFVMVRYADDVRHITWR